MIIKCAVYIILLINSRRNLQKRNKLAGSMQDYSISLYSMYFVPCISTNYAIILTMHRLKLTIEL